MAIKMYNGAAVLDIERFEVVIKEHGGKIVNIGLARFDGLEGGTCIVRMCFADKEVDEYMVTLQYTLKGSMQFYTKMVKLEVFEGGGVKLLEDVIAKKKQQLNDRKSNKKQKLIKDVEGILIGVYGETLREDGTSMDMAKAVVEHLVK